MRRYANRRALAVQLVIAIILVGVNVTTSSALEITAWVAAFLIVSTALNVLITWSRHRAEATGQR